MKTRTALSSRVTLWACLAFVALGANQMSANTETRVERWGVFELVLDGPDSESAYVDVILDATPGNFSFKTTADYTALRVIAAKSESTTDSRPRVIATSDGEIDDECSMVRFLHTNEWDVEAIISSSSQYHSHRQNWAGDDWVEPYLDAYAKIYPNLLIQKKKGFTEKMLLNHFLP